MNLGAFSSPPGTREDLARIADPSRVPIARTLNRQQAVVAFTV
jgi:hypothetical protein